MADQPRHDDSSGPDRPGVPEYNSILIAHRWLRIVSMLVGGGGWLCIIGGTFLLIGVLIAELRSPRPMGWTPFQIPVQLMLIGLIALVIAVILRLIASIGLAVRDLARNSFRK